MQVFSMTPDKGFVALRLNRAERRAYENAFWEEMASALCKGGCPGTHVVHYATMIADEYSRRLASFLDLAAEVEAQDKAMIEKKDAVSQ